MNFPRIAPRKSSHAILCYATADSPRIGYTFRFHQKALDTLADTEALKNSDVLITDYYLPELTGVELVHQVRVLFPQLPAIVLTGSREAQVTKAVQEISHCLLLHKPLDVDTLEMEIEKLMRSPAA